MLHCSWNMMGSGVMGKRRAWRWMNGRMQRCWRMHLQDRTWFASATLYLNVWTVVFYQPT